MREYPEYKASGVEWLGDIPEHWTNKKFSQVSYMKGRIGWQGLKQNEFTFNSDEPFLITGMNFKDGIIRWDEVYHISQERYDEAPEIQLQNNDVLFTKDGTIGKVLYIDEIPYPHKASLNSHLLVFRPLRNSYLHRYLFYQLQSFPFKQHIEITKKGSTFFGISQESVGEYKFILPLLSEQKVIVNFLDYKTRLIDNFIANRRQQIELLKEQKVSIINKGITRGFKEDVKLKKSETSTLDYYPEHWVLTKIKHLLQTTRGAIRTGPFGTQLKNSDLVENGAIKIYNQRSVINKDFVGGNEYISLDKFDTLKEFIVYPNDLLLTTRGTIGKCAIFPNDVEIGVLHPCLIRLQLNQKKILNEYAILCFENALFFQEEIKLLSNSTVIEVIYSYNLKEVFIPLPLVEEQKEIIEYIKTETAKIDTLITKYQKQIELMQEYRTALISQAVTGKIDVRNWQPKNKA